MLKLRSRSAFTLIELLVVVIIVAVLAAVGVPLLSANVQRARTSEVDTGLGAIRTGMRAHLAEFGSYHSTSNPTNGVTPIAANIGLAPGDLTGRFFEDDDYAALTAAATTFCASATGDAAGAAPRGNQVVGVGRSMDELGHIYNVTGCTPASAIVN